MLMVLFIAISSQLSMHAQKTGTANVSGTVFEYSPSGSDPIPLEFALVSIPDYEMAVTTDASGSYTFKNVPKGTVTFKVTFIGKVPLEKKVDISENTAGLNFTLSDENFKLKEVLVTAQTSQADGATSSIIGRNAMDHLQASSLADVMSLLPGKISSNADLSSSSHATIRAASGTSSMNSLGTAIIRDGAPISNNANLSILSATASANSNGQGGPDALVSGSNAPTGGADLRAISTDNIESVEVIRGIPSVEHGDIISGAVIINSKAGREPLRITGRINPNVYMGAMSTGFNLGQNRGGLNVSLDYAHNTNDPVESYRTYQRFGSRVMYSKEFSKSFRSNTSLSFSYGKNSRSLNPDDADYQRKSRAERYSTTFNTNGLWSIDWGVLKSLRYVASATYSSDQSYYQVLTSSNNNPFSATYTDGAVLSNFAGERIYDADGNEITNFGDADAANFAYCIPSNYLTRQSIDSREVNIFVKAVATLFKKTGYINNRMLIGADFRSDGNVGHGMTFDPLGPPQRPIDVSNGSYRARDYRDIPFINQLGVFAEENFMWQLGLHELRVQAGVRYDHANVVGGVWSPRFNASFEVLPNKLWIHGGYGVTAKMPTLMYLYPQDAYHEYINVNELTKSAIPEEQRLYITTTKVDKVDVSDLKISTNRKAEAGIDLRLNKMTFSVTGFYEKLKNGYSISQSLKTFSPFAWTTYSRKNATDALTADGTYNVLSSWYAPGNNLASENRGIEFDFNFGRIEKINTAFSINGAYTRSKSWDNALKFYDPDIDKAAKSKRDIAIYAGHQQTTYNENFTTALRITHNIPRIGFVVTLTGETVWRNASWIKYQNDELPIGYLSLHDGLPYYFGVDATDATGKVIPSFQNTDELQANDDFKHMYRSVTHSGEIKESYKPYFCFNMNVTKELGSMMRVSFFANNMFRSYPRRASKRNLGTYYLMNKRFYFGVELQITI